MNHSVRTAFRSTDLKVVLMSLIVTTAIAVIAIDTHQVEPSSASASFTSSNVKAES